MTDHITSLALGGDGLLYGLGCSASGGCLLRFDSAGSLSVLHHFSNTPDGYYPYGGLTVGADGALYGITAFGGSTSHGTVFRWDMAGVFTIVHNFESPSSGGGAFPKEPLLLAKDGALYGVTPFSTVYRVDSGGTTSYPLPLEFITDSPLVQGNDCAFYGVAIRPPRASLVYRLFEPGHLCQRIEFDPLPDRVLGQPRFTVDAAASSGLPVSFQVSGRCSIRGDQVHLRGVGTCTVTAYQDGDSRFAAAASVTQEFRMRPPHRMRRLRKPHLSDAGRDWN